MATSPFRWNKPKIGASLSPASRARAHLSSGGDGLFARVFARFRGVPYARPPHRLHRLRLRHSVPLAFFRHDAFAQLRRHLLRVARRHIQLRRNPLIRQVQPHQIQTQYPYLQRLMMTFKDRLRQIVKLPLAGLTLIPLAFGRVRMEPPLRDLGHAASGTPHAFRPAQLADYFIALGIIHQILDMD